MTTLYSDKVTIGLIQLACGEVVAANVNRTIEKIQEVASKGAQIICLQELFDSLYFPQTVSVKNYELSASVKIARHRKP
ncbi:nitrilase-related carbon-nitrogen hydrolase [Brevibacillus migulae]|uniref:nitrilase-related carbon-nitrogen hydrolase n=1 Tax=Brevibacillus migulae TaxID=1644114 RepID=UPI001F207B2C|nr:nitrilase-related carbon-nitrogen hydrolase [Brevibacillus migulae]